jgi:D-xylose 1-dehydrogenase (NADP+, D-xylono-1,5-lactone-forming)
MNAVRWGVLGAAAIATSRFMPAMQEASSARLVAIASRSLDKAKAVAQEFGVPRAYGSYEELFESARIGQWQDVPA